MPTANYYAAPPDCQRFLVAARAPDAPAAPISIVVNWPLLLGRFSDLPEYARQNQVHVIYVCMPISKQPRIRTLLDALGDTTASIYFVPDL